MNSLPSTESQFGESYTYDANGNILTLQRRNQAGQLFDDMSYKYHNVNGGYNRNTNQLRYVLDAVQDAPDPITGLDLHPEDIENQGIDNYTNYTYDEIGNLAKDVAEDIDRIEWTVSGKVAAVIRTEGSDKADLYFSYDAMGNRISKTVVDKILGNAKITYYFRDASGNVMAVYEKISSSALKVKEFDIYGSSRLGNYTPLFSSRNYEFSDHLGNVHLVLNDKGEAQSATEYYPFGMVMQSINSDYRYGFNSQEVETELNPSITSAEYWFYDGRLGRRWNIDPIEFAHLSGYSTMFNSPISINDPKGDTPPYGEGQCTECTTVKDGNTTITAPDGTSKSVGKATGIISSDGKVDAEGYNYAKGVWAYTNDKGEQMLWDHKQKSYVINNSNKSPSENSFPMGVGKMGTTYAGGDNPKSKDGKTYDYSQPPLNIADYYGLVHDKDFDAIPLEGTGGTYNAKSSAVNEKLVDNMIIVQKMYFKGEIDPYTGVPVSLQTYQTATIIRITFDVTVEAPKVITNIPYHAKEAYKSTERFWKDVYNKTGEGIKQMTTPKFWIRF